MSTTRQYEQIAVSQIQKTLTHLSLVTENLSAAASTIDNFPTARHEMQDLANKAAQLEKDLLAIQRKLNIIKTK